MIGFAKLAADVALPTATSTARCKGADPALVQLVTDAASDGKRRDLPGRFSVEPYPGREGANESQTVVNELHRAARSAGVKLNVRCFDATRVAASGPAPRPSRYDRCSARQACSHGELVAGVGVFAAPDR